MLDRKTVDKIIDMIKQEKSYDEIIEATGVSKNTISRINQGKAHRRKRQTYPIRQFYLEAWDIEPVRTMLKENKLSIKEISQRTGLTTEMIYHINAGRQHHDFLSDYPLRPLTIEHLLPQIWTALKNNDVPMVNIARQFNISPSMVAYINQGKRWYNPDLTYPLR